MNLEAALKPYKTTFGKLEAHQHEDLVAFLTRILDEPIEPYLMGYILSTVGNESYHLFRPQEWKDRKLGKFYGRGIIPLRGEEAYRRASELTGVNLVRTPKRVLEPEFAYDLAVRGMMEGVYTGVRLVDFAGATGKKLWPARAVIEPEWRQYLDRYIVELVDRTWIKVIYKAKGISTVGLQAVGRRQGRVLTK